MEIERIAKEGGKTRSQVVALFLRKQSTRSCTSTTPSCSRRSSARRSEEAVHQKLHLNHAVMLAPIIREAVIRAFQPLLPLLLSIAYDASQTRYLTTNLLAKQAGPEELDSIREKTAKKAKHTILHKRPHIAELVELVKASLPDLWEVEEPDATRSSRPSGGSRV